MADNYWFILDMPVVAYNDDNIGLTFKDSVGDPVDVSGWTAKTYKASGDSSWTADSIEVANAAMSVTSSGSGVDDTIVIPISSTDSAITTGLYNHEFVCTISSQDRTIFRGTIRILERIAEVP